jgi:hypothetical protein
MRFFFNILCPVCQKLLALISPFVDFEKKNESAGEKHLPEYEITVSSLPGLVPYYEHFAYYI